MYIQVRTIDGKKRITVSISKTATIKELKTQIQDELETPVDKQRLFFRGKQLENEHTLFDYGINLNDVVQLMIKQDDLIPSKTSRSEERLQETSADEAEKQNGDADKDNTNVIKEDKYYRVGDKVDCQGICGAWFEGEIKEIIKPTDEDQEQNEEAALTNLYKVKFLNDEEADTVLALKNIRPRAGNLISIENIKKGDVVIANYNGDDPEQPGFWYTCVVTSVSSSTRKPKLIVTIEISREDEAKLHNCKIKFIDNVFRLEEHKLISERTENDSAFINGAEIPQRDLKAEFCNECRDNQAVESCKKCGCQKCTLKSDPNLTILCDECDNAYHIYCLNPPLESVPEDDDWYCPDCKNDENEIVKAGEKLKFSKKKSKMASKISASEGNKSRDWGKGMACVGRTKECTLVPPNHFGPIPGIEVGTTWKFRVQVSEAGVHRPHVAGIHGRESEGAYSIVLSGGYEDDVDNGESFFFTGSGGRDLSGNKRTAEQSCDQTLTRYNLALALNCNATMNTKDGATAKDWKNGKPVRVVRNFKLQKHSKYAPEEGNRYDGIYKVVKYYPEKGKSGYLVWRYLLRRDDPTPAPWTSEGKALIKTQGLDVMLVPDGYKETENGKKTPSGKKRAREGSSEPSEELVNGDKGNAPPKKKTKPAVVAAYKLPEKLKKMITKDTKNTKVWELVMSKLEKGKQEFLSEVQNAFMCICCLELINNPVTTDCSHNVCKSCLVRSFKSEVYTCAHCRFDFGKDYKIEVNDQLQNILSELFPGYNSGR